MPVTLKQGLMKYKNGQGEYVGINTVGETGTAQQIAAITTAGTTQVGNVNQAGTTQTQAVNTAGNTQVQAVNAAGTTQVSAVNTKGQEVLESIPADYSELSEDVSSLKSAFDSLDDEVHDPVTGLDGKAPVIISTASGDIASFDDGADGMPVNGMTVQIEPVQEGTGDPSPTNVRPITGWTGATVTRTGKNLFDKDHLVGIGFGSGTLVAGDFAGFYCECVPGVTYTLSRANGTATPRFAIAFTKEIPAHNVVIYNKAPASYNNTETSLTVTAPDGSKYVCVYLNNSGIVVPDDANVQLEIGSTVTDFVPYQGTTLPISWQTEAGTVYGGTLDPVAGTLTVYNGEVTLNGSETWTTYNAYHGFSSRLLDMKSATRQNGLCDLFPVVKNTPSTPAVWLGVSNNILYVINTYDIAGIGSDDSGEVKVQKWKAYLANHPLQVVYPLAEPIVYRLSPNEIRTLFGSNRIWADCGPISVDYCADTKTYVDDAIPVQDVQVNGTSVLNNGVANVPVASSTGFGVVGIDNNNGINIASGKLYVVGADSTRIKSSNSSYRPIVPTRQHESVFYGLTKAAGVDMASSSNAVGTYTDAAKVAIQKMLGIYQAPWELIREDDITNATQADIEITVDGNGNAFELTDARLMVSFPTQDVQAGLGDYGRISFYYNDSASDDLFIGSFSQAVGTSRGGQAQIIQRDGMIERSVVPNNTASLSVQMAVHNGFTTSNSSHWQLETKYYKKIVIKAVTGRCRYILYGKRKWN